VRDRVGDEPVVRRVADAATLERADRFLGRLAFRELPFVVAAAR
jgi:hypothetical protein